MTSILAASTTAQLNADINEVNAAASGTFVIQVTANITQNAALNAINLAAGVSLVIDGTDGASTYTLDSAGYAGLSIAAGCTIQNLTIADSASRPSIAAAASWTAYSSTITMGTSNPGAIVTGMIVYDATTGVQIGTVSSYSGTTLTLTQGAVQASSGPHDSLQFIVPAATLAGGELAGSVTISSSAFVLQTGQLTFGATGNPATVINQGTWDIANIVSITDGTENQSSLFENEGLLELTSFEQGTGSGVSRIYVNTTDTGTLSVPDDGSAPGASGSNIRFFGASNSFAGTAATPVIYSGYMVDYGAGTNTVGYVDMVDGACSTNFYGSTVNQTGVVSLTNESTISNQPGATWNLTTNNGMLEAPDQANFSQPAFDNEGTLAKTGGTGTTDLAINYNLYGGGGFIIIDVGTLSFDAPDTLEYSGYNNIFSDTISGAGIFSLAGGSADAINSGTSIASSGWTITDAGTDVTLNESLSYAGAFTDESGATLTLANDVTLTLTNLAGSGGSINFDSDAELKFGGQSPSLFAATVDGFAPGNVIDLTSIADVAGSHADMNYATNVLTITEGSNNYTLDFNPTQNFVGDYFHLATDGAGTNITENTTPCYCRGTLIRTERGEVPVEALTIGSKVLTMSGDERSIKWIGRRAYAGRFIMGRTDVLPICIRAGSLYDHVPRRDLWLSPHHALYLDGLLIEAKDLINGVSIVQADSVEKVEYFHIELETHDVIIAEGALAESFIDDDSRGLFNNVHEYRQLYGDAATGFMQFCAPRLEEGYQVEVVRRRIALRAELQAGEDKPGLGELRGFVERVCADTVEGWAQNMDHPDAPVCLDIYASDRLIGQVLANRYREDLAEARLGSGRHGFIFTLPNGSLIGCGKVEVRRSLDAAPLPASTYQRIAAQAKLLRTASVAGDIATQDECVFRSVRREGSVFHRG